MSLKPTATANERRPERRRRFLVSSSLDKSHRFFHYFSRATDAGDDARPLDGDNGMCDDDGLLRSGRNTTTTACHLFYFSAISHISAESFYFQHMTLSHRCYHPPRPVPGAPARRLRRPAARRSDPMAIGKLVRSRLHKVSIL